MPFPTELLKIADMLETTLPAFLVKNGCRFDMGVFRDDITYHGSDNERTAPRCGTAACAAGWASMLLPELGLLSRAGSGGLSLKAEVRTYYDFEAIAVACGITWKEAIVVFNTDQGNDPLAVAVAIRKFVAQKEAASVPT